MSKRIKLENPDLYLILYDYMKNFRGTYPFVTRNDGVTSHFPGELFKHFMRRMMKINHKTCSAEMDMIYVMRNNTPKKIIRMATEYHPILKKRSNCDEKLIYINKEESRIRSTCLQFHRQQIAEANAEVIDAQKGKATAQYADIAEFTQMTGRRFRMKKEQKERYNKGTLTREAAFQEIYGS